MQTPNFFNPVSKSGVMTLRCLNFWFHLSSHPQCFSKHTWNLMKRYRHVILQRQCNLFTSYKASTKLQSVKVWERKQWGGKYQKVFLWSRRCTALDFSRCFDITQHSDMPTTNFKANYDKDSVCENWF